MLLLKLLFLTNVLWFTEVSAKTKTPVCNEHGNQNEVFSQCGNNECQNTCRNPTGATFCSSGICIPGCVCSPGFLRNSLHHCVRPEQCDTRPVCPGVNEVFSFCGNNGCQRACNRLDVFNCVPICSIPACICAEGFVRNLAGVCVLPTTCVTGNCPGQNQVFSACGDDGCQRRCNRLVVTNCNPVCSTAACVCAPGFVRTTNGDCVLQSACPTISCSGENEVFSVCGNNGCQRSCNRLDVTNCVPRCGAPGCICGAGFVRNAVGFCVIQTTCSPPTCPGLNEVFSFCGNDGCQRSCTRLDVSTCNPICGPPACICAPGLVRNAALACVASTACTTTLTPTTCTAANEVFSTCGRDNCQGTCTAPAVASCIPTCVPGGGCICMPGFTLNALGACIPIAACPPITCPGANEVSSTCGNDGCQRSCTRLTVPTTCTPMCTGTACVCAAGFVRNAALACVLPTQCPVTTCPGLNQVFSFCGDDGCQKTCSRLDVTNCVPVCRASSCICAPGFVRNALLACVAQSTCPALTCVGANEVLSACGNNGCQPSCRWLDMTGCRPICSGVPACLCASGFVRNAAGLCVMSSTCPTTCTSASEVFSACGNTVCQATCGRAAITPCASGCVPGCICAAGMLRNSIGQCVPMASCNVCGANEVSRTCGPSVCEGTCATPNLPTSTSCTTVGACSTKCFCTTGFVRNTSGACVASC